MKKRRKSFLAASIAGILLWTSVNSMPHNGNVTEPTIVPTYECAGIYWKVEESGSCKIRYREPDNKWIEGLDLIYDTRDAEYRGSIVGLRPNTSYEVELANRASGRASGNYHLGEYRRECDPSPQNVLILSILKS